MNSATRTKNVVFHFGIPSVSLVTKVDAAAKHFFNGNLSHYDSPWLIVIPVQTACCYYYPFSV
jgi:hypothetical protein